jgi:hypothetical protein
MPQQNIRETLLIVGMIFLLIIGALAVFNWTSVRVISEIPSDFRVGNKLSGKITFPAENFDLESSLVFLITHGETETANTVKLSSLPSEKISTSKNKYSIELSEVIDFTFESEGEYELFINDPLTGTTLSKKFTVSR